MGPRRCGHCHGPKLVATVVSKRILFEIYQVFALSTPRFQMFQVLSILLHKIPVFGAMSDEFDLIVFPAMVNFRRNVFELRLTLLIVNAFG